MKYQDIHTNKIFTVKGSKVFDQFGNVATISARDWLKMQGGDVVKIAVKSERVAAGRDLDGYQLNRGTVMMYLTASTEQGADQMAAIMAGLGFNHTGCAVEVNELLYMVDSSDLADFKNTYRLAKATLLN